MRGKRMQFETVLVLLAALLSFAAVVFVSGYLSESLINALVLVILGTWVIAKAL